jgi:MGT family glycosyltransferase
VPTVLAWIGVTSMAADFAPMVTDQLAELRAIARLEDRPVAPFDDRVWFTLVPPTFDGPEPVNATLHRFSELGPASRLPQLPDPWGDPDQPFVYVTFGSVTATVGPFASIYRAVVDALAEFPARILLTTGQGVDATTLGTVPAHIRVEPWWPQADVMPAAAAMVGHGGFGTTMGALAAGVPQVVAPLFAADQFLNAARVDAIGVGRQVLGGENAAALIADALHDVLTTPDFRTCAGAIAAEIAGLPAVATAVPIIEAVASAGGTR